MFSPRRIGARRGETLLSTINPTRRRQGVKHEQMRRHVGCRVDRCVWKAAAYYTLVDAGRLAPQTLSPRERAAARGIAFPPLENEPPAASGGPTPQTLREVLDKLAELTLPVPSTTTTNHG
jgi:hypothetical protein